MNVSDIFSASALAISIAGIYLQRIDGRKQLTVANFSEYTSRYQELVRSFPLSVVREDFDLLNLSDFERERVLRNMLLYFDLCYEEYFLHRSNLIDSRIWRVWKEGMQAALSRPAFQQSWIYISAQRGSLNDPAFVDMIDSMIKAK